MNLTAMILTIGIPILVGVLGFFLGAFKFFREEKQKAYRELLPPILKFAFNRQTPTDEKAFNEALSKLWLYGSTEVTDKMNRAVSVMHNHSRGDMIGAFQETVVAMRKDIQISPWQQLEPEEVSHLYTRIVKQSPISN